MVTNIVEYISEVFCPWFEKWEDTKSLIQSSDSPLGEKEIAALQESLEGKAKSEDLENSCKFIKNIAQQKDPVDAKKRGGADAARFWACHWPKSLDKKLYSILTKNICEIEQLVIIKTDQVYNE